MQSIFFQTTKTLVSAVLSRVSVGCTFQKVRFLTLRLIYLNWQDCHLVPVPNALLNIQVLKLSQHCSVTASPAVDTCAAATIKINIANSLFQQVMVHCWFMWLKLSLQRQIIIQSTLVISNSKGLSEILRDIRSSTYQVCRIEEKIIWLTTFNKLIGNWTFEVRDILKILWKRGEIAP